jgi:hypothetical protein
VRKNGGCIERIGVVGHFINSADEVKASVIAAIAD